MAFSLNGDGWDEPERIDEPFTCNVAEYVLGGEFLNRCQDGSPLKQEDMMVLNKDVCNRFYTLLEDGWLWIPNILDGKPHVVQEALWFDESRMIRVFDKF